jgi:hypothetical protein
MREEAEDLVADLVTADAGAHSLDYAGKVAAEDDRKLMLDHFPHGAGSDEGVDGVDGGGEYPHEHGVVADFRFWEVFSQRGVGVEGLEGESPHLRLRRHAVPVHDPLVVEPEQRDHVADVGFVLDLPRRRPLPDGEYRVMDDSPLLHQLGPDRLREEKVGGVVTV